MHMFVCVYVHMHLSAYASTYIIVIIIISFFTTFAMVIDFYFVDIIKVKS